MDSQHEQEASDSDDFTKVADIVPELHCVNCILKVFEIESVLVQDPTAS